MKNKRYDRIVEKSYDRITEIKKFNQNHDNLGRFSSGGGGGSSGKITSLKFHEASHEEMSKAVAAAKASCDVSIRWRVDAHTPEEYAEKGCRNFISENGDTVSVTKSGDIISVCARGDSPRGTGALLMQKAVEMGGNKLDSFAGNHGFYEKMGFQAVSSTPFTDNPDWQPPGWKESGQPKETVVAYKHVGKGNVNHMEKADLENPAKIKLFTGEDGYDKMIEYRDNEIRGDKR